MPVPIQPPDPSTPAADDLSYRVGELNDSIQGLRDDVLADRAARLENTRVLQDKLTQSARALRATRRLWFGFAVLVLIGFVVNWLTVSHFRWIEDQRQEDATRAAVVNCMNTNKAREARELRDEQLGGLLLDALGEIVPAATPEDLARRQDIISRVEAAYVQKLRDTLPVELQQRDCGEEAVTAPTLVGESQPG